MTDSPAPTDPAGPTTRRNVRTALVVVAVLAVVAAWIYVLFVYRPAKQIDELTDRTFPTAAEKICAATMAKVDALPIASTAANPKERGDTVASANAELSSMVDQLRSVQPDGDTPEDKGVREWVDDWQQHVDDREVYAADLQSGEDARFLESTKGARQLSRAIDAFAQVNRMPACETPEDVG